MMDDPDLDPRLHDQALVGLERLNIVSRSAGILWPDIADLARRLAPRPVRVLDLACGSGDVAVSLWRRARRAGLDVSVAGCDISPHAVASARERARKAGADVAFFTHDVLGSPLPEGYDVLSSSLFLHHLDEGPAVDLLVRMARAARLVLINDLERGRMSYVLTWLGCQLLTRSPVVHVDGPRSIEGAFTLTEARVLAARADLEGATVSGRWPCRFLLRWELQDSRRPAIPVA
jgi:SAM-dependent methyltransferase